MATLRVGMVLQLWERPRLLGGLPGIVVAMAIFVGVRQMPPRPIHPVTIPRLLRSHLKCPDLITKRRCHITFITTRTPTTDLMVMAHMAVLEDNRLYVTTKPEGIPASNERRHSRKRKAGLLRISNRQKDVLRLCRAFSIVIVFRTCDLWWHELANRSQKFFGGSHWIGLPCIYLIPYLF